VIINKNKLLVFGREKPKETKRNKVIKRAIKRAVRDYSETFIRLANT